jgi:hypothetical protein
VTNHSEKLDEMRETINDVKEEDEPGTARKVLFYSFFVRFKILASRICSIYRKKGHRQNRRSIDKR